MDNDRLKELFDGFQPELPADDRFMDSLLTKMEAVEIVRQHTLALKRRYRTAVCVAGATGFAAGLLLAWLLPLVADFAPAAQMALPWLATVFAAIDGQLVVWTVAAAASAITAVNAFELTLARLAARETAT